MLEITKKSKRQVCQTCGRKSFKISQHGNCVNCAAEKVALANLEMKHKEGPTYKKWKIKMQEVLFG